MAKKQYLSPTIEVNALHDEDVITASVWKTEVDGKEAIVTVGGFSSSWLG